MRALLILLFLAIFTFSFGQSIETKFFKKAGYKEIKESKAKYKQITTTYDGGLRKIELFLIKENSTISLKSYKNDIPNEQWLEINEKGDTLFNTYYKLVYGDAKTDIYSKDTVNFVPANSGSNEERIRYLAKTIRYPEDAKEKNIQGTVYLNFKVTKDGSVKDVIITQGVHESLDFEAYRAIINMYNWTPAMKDGKAVDSYFNMPIKFILAGVNLKYY